jgi:hypothetical protein
VTSIAVTSTAAPPTTAPSRTRPRVRRATREYPFWQTRDVRRLLITLVVAAVGLGLSWFGTSGTASWSRQMGWLSLGVIAVALAGIGIAQWLLTALRAVRVRQSRIADSIAARLVLDTEDDADAARPAELVTAPKMVHFHRADCPLVARKAMAPLRPADRDIYRPCGVCRP